MGSGLKIEVSGFCSPPLLLETMAGGAGGVERVRAQGLRYQSNCVALQGSEGRESRVKHVFAEDFVLFLSQSGSERFRTPSPKGPKP